eukprot:m.283272 g.283272  ORF g.283272 m.283272 type:complete len:483 (+) comp19876_c0_seq3:328-1776(+)
MCSKCFLTFVATIQVSVHQAAGELMVFRADRCNTNADVDFNWVGNTMSVSEQAEDTPSSVGFGLESSPFLPVDVLMSGNLTAGGGLFLEPSLALTLDNVALHFDSHASGHPARFVAGQSESDPNCALSCKENWRIAPNISVISRPQDLLVTPARAPCRLDTAVMPPGYNVAVVAGDGVIVYGGLRWFTIDGQDLTDATNIPSRQIRPSIPILFVGPAAVNYCTRDPTSCTCGSFCSGDVSTAVLSTTRSSAPGSNTGSSSGTQDLVAPIVAGVGTFILFLSCILVYLFCCGRGRASKGDAESRLFASFQNPAYVSPALAARNESMQEIEAKHGMLNPIYERDSVYSENRTSQEISADAYSAVALRESRPLSFVLTRSDMSDADFGFSENGIGDPADMATGSAVDAFPNGFDSSPVPADSHGSDPDSTVWSFSGSSNIDAGNTAEAISSGPSDFEHDPNDGYLLTGGSTGTSPEYHFASEEDC